MGWVKILIVCSIPVLYKMVNNLSSWIELARYEKIYPKYCSIRARINAAKKRADPLPDKEIKILKKIEEDKLKIIGLFNKAGLKSPLVTVMRPAGHNHVVPAQLDVFENLDIVQTVVDTDIPGIIIKTFTTSIGVYKERFWQALKPWWWLNLLIHLPERLVSYLGIPVENSNIRLIAKTLNAVYWLIGVIIGILVFFHYGYITIGHINISIS